MTGLPPAVRRGSRAAALLASTVLLCAACATPQESEPAPRVSAPAKEATSSKPPPPPVAAVPVAPRPPAPPPREKSRAEQDLERGVKSYEDGDYKSASRQFQSALALGLPALSDQATAHKYLAFIACASGRQRPCRDEFRKALEADNAFVLTPAEAGHPVWGPVFRSVKADMAKARPK